MQLRFKNVLKRQRKIYMEQKRILFLNKIKIINCV